MSVTIRDFCYWLQGYFEITGDSGIAMTPDKLATIQRHLALVFVHEIDPSAGDAAVQEKLNAVRNSHIFVPHPLNLSGVKMRC